MHSSTLEINQRLNRSFFMIKILHSFVLGFFFKVSTYISKYCSRILKFFSEKGRVIKGYPPSPPPHPSYMGALWEQSARSRSSLTLFLSWEKSINWLKWRHNLELCSYLSHLWSFYNEHLVFWQNDWMPAFCLRDSFTKLQ